MANKINQIEIDSIIYDLQDKDAKAPFTGTKAEVQLAIAEGKIKEGDIVNITDDINDYPGGGGDYPSGASNIVYLTQEQYDALPDDKLTDDIEYRIMDEGFEATAVNIGYDNSKSGLSAETVQEAVDELSRRPSGGESNIVYLTQEQYDELPDTKLTDGVEYRVTDAGVRGSAENVSYDGSASGLNAKNVQEAVDAIAAGAGNAANVEYLTQAQYDELGEEKLSNGIEYRITDAGTPTTASNVGFDGTASGIDAVNVQGAIEKVNNSLASFGYNDLYLWGDDKVDLLNYSADNPYITPCIGLARVTYNGSIFCKFYNKSSTTNKYGFGTILEVTSGTSSFFVPKGVKLYGSTSNNGIINFIPLGDVE